MAFTEPVPNLSSLQQYTRIKQTIAQELRTLAEFLRNHLGDRESEECRQLMAKLAEDRFVLAVVGQFKRGKSSLMNAIIGRDLLPTGVLPLTSVITILKYGPKDKLTILKDGAKYPEEVPVSSIADHVTEKGNPGNAKRVACAALETPVQFLRRGLEFVDTPGIGSAIEANTLTTYNFLPQSDAVIFVTSVDAPLTQAETDFLQSIHEHVRKIFFVVNKIDLASGNEQQAIVEFISATLTRQAKADALRIFPVSSMMALSSILSHEDDGYEKSGLKALQEALSHFLTGEKSKVLLISVLDKVLRLNRKVSAQMHFLKLAGDTSKEEIENTTKAVEKRFENLRSAREKELAGIRERTMAWMEQTVSPKVNSFLAGETDAILGDLHTMLLTLPLWKPPRRAIKKFTQRVHQRLCGVLEEGIKQLTEDVSSRLCEMLNQEWARLEQQLQRIPVEAREALGMSPITYPCDEGVISRFNCCGLPQRSIKEVKQCPALPKCLAFLPVFFTRRLLRKRLRMEISRLISVCRSRVGDALSWGVHQVVDRMGSEMAKQATDSESRIMQAMNGKRLLRVNDGHWRTSDLDAGELAKEMSTVAEIERRLGLIQNQMLQTNSAFTSIPSIRSEMETAKPSFVTIAKQDSTVPEENSDFSYDLKTRGCPVCNEIVDASSRFFASWQYALSTQESARRAHASSLGFCPLHTWQLEAMASPHGLSIGFSNIAERLSSDLGRIAASEASHTESVLSLVQDQKRCNVCRLAQNAEKQYIGGLAGYVRTDPGLRVYEHSQGVCLRHLGMLIGEISTGETVRFLLDHAARRFLEVAEDMRTYALKHDALRRDIQNQDDRDAYLRALIRTVGAKRVCFPWEMNKEI